jgi:predicted metalloprotease
MDEQPNVSPKIVDHRRSAATHGFTGLMSLVLGFLFGMSVGSPPVDHDRDLVIVTSTALDRSDDFWSARLEHWRSPHVVLVDHAHGERTPCGTADERSGPFYCPSNERIYLDVAFLRSIRGELARAYVTAHEVGHHVQKVRGLLGSSRPQIDIELQADCFAGMWMHEEQLHDHLAPGDVDAAIAEASAVGDDRICPTCSTEQWTHGSSDQRVAALAEGLRGGPCR